MTVGGANVVGCLVALNRKGAVLSGFVSKEERTLLRDLSVLALPHRLNAAGNNVLCNDLGAVVNPGYDDRTVRMISETLGVDAVRGTLAGMRTVGSAGLATNKGVLAHPHVTEAELHVIIEALQVPAKITTANYGTAQIGACVVANSKGAVIGGRTTPIEIDRIQDGLGLY
jgi:translation initiation factor 6